MDVSPDLLGTLEALATPLPEVDMAQLRRMEPETFGFALASFVEIHDLSPLILSETAKDEFRKNDLLPVRYALLHDAFHVLLGFNHTLAGE